jgi:1,4-alpha-glucan branching enzyme
MISQANISPNTPMGANLVAGGGATFRAWAPLATAVYINGTFGASSLTGQTDNLLLAKDANGYWTGFVSAAQEGDAYTFWVVGPSGSGPKRDPYARELAPASAFPNCNNLIRSARAYRWHDAAFVTPDFSNMIIYQLHIGTYNPAASGTASNFLDIAEKISPIRIGEPEGSRSRSGK